MLLRRPGEEPEGSLSKRGKRERERMNVGGSEVGAKGKGEGCGCRDVSVEMRREE